MCHRHVRSSEPEQTARELVRLANELGGTDNVSVVVVRIDDLPEAAEGLVEPSPDREENTRQRPQLRAARLGLLAAVFLLGLACGILVGFRL